MKNRLINVLMTIVFIVGLCLASYPIVSRVVNLREANKAVLDFDQGKKEIPDAEIARRIKLAEAYNYSIGSHDGSLDFKDPFSKKEMEEGRKEYAKMLEVHEKIGYIKIPSIKLELPIYAGTSEVVLQKAAGHLEGTSLPVGGIDTHTVITAHRGLPTARLFTDLDKVERGDKFYIHNIQKTLAYQVDSIKVIKPEEINYLQIIKGHDCATLLTCTPYMVNSHRLLVRGHRVPYTEKDREEESKRMNTLNLFELAVIIIVLVLLLLLVVLLRKKKKKKGRQIDEDNTVIEE